VRIALITPKLTRGDGQGRVNYEIARAALDAGHAVSLVAGEIAPDLAAHENARAVRLDVAHWPSALLQTQVFALRSAWWLARHRAELDLVHANGFVTWPRTDVNTSHFVHAAWLRSPQHSSRIRRDAYGLYQWLYTRTGAWLERLAYRHTAAIVAVSQHVERELRSTGLAAERIRVIPNGVDLEEFAPGAAQREALGLPDGVLLLFVGDIKTPRKNLDTLLRALRTTDDAMLAVVGDTTGSPYPALAAELGVAERVRFLGYRRDIASLMQSADVFVFPSRYEACSLVLLEAAASGLPIVAAWTAGGVELLGRDCNVLLESPDDETALATALNALIHDPVRRVRMGTAARAVAEQYSWRTMGAHYLDLYRQIGAARERMSLRQAS
jgi:glycosyltransferase involved in cell wall biosynthesis